MAHGGGKRLDVDSPSYRVLLSLDRAGHALRQAERSGRHAHRGAADANGCSNATAPQQLTVIAHHSDGSTVDVTRMAQFESNERDLAERRRDRPRHDQASCRAPSPSWPATRRTSPSSAPWCRSARRWRSCRRRRTSSTSSSSAAEEARPAAVAARATTATFLRRVTIDIAGRLPTLEETTGVPRRQGRRPGTRSSSIGCWRATTTPTTSRASGAPCSAIAGKPPKDDVKADLRLPRLDPRIARQEHAVRPVRPRRADAPRAKRSRRRRSPGIAR